MRIGANTQLLFNLDPHIYSSRESTHGQERHSPHCGSSDSKCQIKFT